MSTEQPPRITPRTPAGSRPVTTPPRRPSGPVSGETAPSAGIAVDAGPVPSAAAAPAAAAVQAGSAPVDEAPAGPSFADRMKKAAGAARSAVPTGRSPREVEEDEPAAGPRRVRLAVARIDPWSVLKLSFLLSVAIGIMIVVAAAVIWQVLDSMAVFTSVNDVIATLSGSTTFFDVLDYAAFDRVISLATMIAVADIVLLTALSTLGAFLYNVVAALVGGVHLTLTDD